MLAHGKVNLGYKGGKRAYLCSDSVKGAVCRCGGGDHLLIVAERFSKCSDKLIGQKAPPIDNFVRAFESVLVRTRCRIILKGRDELLAFGYKIQVRVVSKAAVKVSGNPVV